MGSLLLCTVQSLLNLSSILQVDLEDGDAVCARVSGPLDRPASTLKGSHHLSPEQAGGAGYQGCLFAHLSQALVRQFLLWSKRMVCPACGVRAQQLPLQTSVDGGWGIWKSLWDLSTGQGQTSFCWSSAIEVAIQVLTGLH